MKKMFFGFCCLIICGIQLTSCSDDETLQPSGILSGYIVPQGNHDYDTSIVNFYNKYGSYLLYKFTGKDTYWTPSGWKNGVTGTVAEGGQEGYLVSEADTLYIKNQLKILERLWFRLYPDSFLKEFLPIKIFLCSDVQYCEFNYSSWPPPYVGVDIPAYYNYDNICVSYGGSNADNLSKGDSLVISRAFNRYFIKSIIGRNLTTPSSDFTSSADYTNVSKLYTNRECWARGIFPPYYSASAENDWDNFLYMMVIYPEDYLTHAPTLPNNDYDYTETSWEGILNPIKDVNGLMKERYEIVRNYFIQNYGIDLQMVGNNNKNYE